MYPELPEAGPSPEASASEPAPAAAAGAAAEGGTGGAAGAAWDAETVLLFPCEGAVVAGDVDENTACIGGLTAHAFLP